MTSISRTCRISGKEFVIGDADQSMLQKLGMPLPTLCPEERQRRRMMFRNDHILYHRKCDMTGKQIISLYDSDAPFIVYNIDLWWSDQWNPMDYGRDYDFTRPFFEQFADLQKDVPRLAINGIGNENCEYTSYAGWSRNCYLTCTADRNEDCFFGYFTFDSNDSADTLYAYDCKLCYECTDCRKCYHCMYGFNLENCMDCVLSRDLIGCQNCFGCIGLRNKKYCFLNRQLSKEEYQEKLSALNLDCASGLNAAKDMVYNFMLQFPRKALDLKGSENVTGDHIKFSRNCFYAFDAEGCEDCLYVSNFIESKDCMDFDFCGDGSEMDYEISSCTQIKNSAFCTNSWGHDSEIYYCDLVMRSKNCFGCIGLNRGQYCILNKQYTKEEYKELLPRIIEHMKSTGEWGEFFPAWLSPFAYNETVAQDYLPLSEDEVKARGLQWKDKKEKASYQGPSIDIADCIYDVDESICKSILTCEVSGDNYKVIPQELAFYKEHGIPVPRRSPNQRFLDRMASRNPRQLWNRTCGKCRKEIVSSYSPERPETVYCEQCYLNSVY